MGEHSGDAAPRAPAEPAGFGSGLVLKLAGKERSFLFEFCQDIISQVRVCAKPLLDSQTPNWSQCFEEDIRIASHHVIVEGIVFHQNYRFLMGPVFEKLLLAPEQFVKLLRVQDFESTPPNYHVTRRHRTDWVELKA